MQLDIHAAVITGSALLVITAAVLMWLGIRSILRGRQAAYFRIRAQRISSGWRMLAAAVVLGFLLFVLLAKGESTAYQYFPPSPTITRSPTITLSPTVTTIPSLTLSPTITLTPSVSNTPTPIPTPFVPLNILEQFISIITPTANAVISPLEFAQALSNALPVNPTTRFDNPVGHLYAVFSYDQMVPGVQWTAIWYYGADVVYFETKPWDGTTGGYGYTDWNPDPSSWIPGDYRVAIFVGEVYKVDGVFTVVGEAPTAAVTPTSRPSATISGPSQEPSPTVTPSRTRTPRPIDTRWPTPTK